MESAKKWRTPVRILGTWFGCGYSPVVPGTMGTLGALPLVWLFAQAGEEGYLGATLLFVLFSVFIAHFYEILVSDRHDQPEFVMDEVAGILVTMALVPLSLGHLALGFLIFRAFDMIKPFPISYVDRKIPGGLGTVADDLLAGVVSNLILHYLLAQGGWPW
jgi:phosphatidylglycerophosphatase A